MGAEGESNKISQEIKQEIVGYQREHGKNALGNTIGTRGKSNRKPNKERKEPKQGTK